jgi:hypothetical protein
LFVGGLAGLGFLMVYSARKPEMPESAPTPRQPSRGPSPPWYPREREPEEIHHEDGSIEHPSVRYERTDVRFRGVFFLLVLTAVFASLHYFSVWEFFWIEQHDLDRLKKSPYALAPAPNMSLPAEPRLEQLDRLGKIENENVYLIEASKERQLDRYGPTEETGYIHVPIDRAMKFVVDKLPVRKEQPPGQSKDQGLVDSGESNSGRMLRGGKP